MKKTIKYEALIDLPFDIKEGDCLFKRDKVFVDKNNLIVPINPEKETKFFQVIVEPEISFDKDCIVLLEKPNYLREVKTNKSFLIPAWVELKVVGSMVRYKKAIPILEFGGKKYEGFEVDLIYALPYYYINSLGKIHKTYKNRDKEADIFRTKSFNMFDQKELAYDALNVIMNKMIEPK